MLYKIKIEGSIGTFSTERYRRVVCKNETYEVDLKTHELVNPAFVGGLIYIDDIIKKEKK